MYLQINKNMKAKKNCKINKICRICLENKTNLQSIYKQFVYETTSNISLAFQTAATTEISIADIINEFTKYPASRKDKLPNGICCKCKDAAQSAYSFKMQTELAYCHLKALYDKTSIPKEPDSLDEEPREEKLETSPIGFLDEPEIMMPSSDCCTKLTIEALPINSSSNWSNYKEEAEDDIDFSNAICSESDKERDYDDMNNDNTEQPTAFLSDNDPNYDNIEEDKNKTEISNSLTCKQEDDNQKLDSAIVKEIKDVIYPEVLMKESRGNTSISGKRGRNPVLWKQNIRKYLHNQGLSYVNSKGTEVTGRSMRPTCAHTCLYACTKHIPEEKRHSIFAYFWSLESEQKKDYYGKFVKKVDIKRRRKPSNPQENPRKKTNFHYFFEVNTGEIFQVCKKYFVNTLSVSERSIYYYFEQLDGGAEGTHGNSNVNQGRNNECESQRKKYNCNECKKNFTSKISLAKHLLLHEQHSFACKNCSETFEEMDKLRQHQKQTHIQSRNFLCNMCGKSYLTNEDLKAHIRRHTGEKPFKCQICDKAFTRSTDLTMHERYHVDYKPHICSLCGKSFHRPYNLKLHMRTHTGEKPYKCSQCPLAFSQSNDLNNHTKVHTGERFRCEMCSANYRKRYELSNHMKSKHDIVLPIKSRQFLKININLHNEAEIEEN